MYTAAGRASGLGQRLEAARRCMAGVLSRSRSETACTSCHPSVSLSLFASLSRALSLSLSLTATPSPYHQTPLARSPTHTLAHSRSALGAPCPRSFARALFTGDGDIRGQGTKHGVSHCNTPHSPSSRLPRSRCLPSTPCLPSRLSRPVRALHRRCSPLLLGAPLLRGMARLASAAVQLSALVAGCPPSSVFGWWGAAERATAPMSSALPPAPTLRGRPPHPPPPCPFERASRKSINGKANPGPPGPPGGSYRRPKLACGVAGGEWCWAPKFAPNFRSKKKKICSQLAHLPHHCSQLTAPLTRLTAGPALPSSVACIRFCRRC